MKYLADIKWREKDKVSIKKMINNYNSKLKRLKNKGYDVNLLPENTNFSKLKSKIKTREDFNNEMELMKSVTARYSENTIKTARGANVPYFTIHQNEVKLKIINKERKKERKRYEKLPITDRNKKLGVNAVNFDNENLSKLKDRKVNYKNMSKKDLEFFNESLQNYDEKMEKKNATYVENFFKSLETVLSPDNYNKLMEVMKGVPNELIVEKYYTDLNMSIKFNYEPTDDETKFEVLFDSWEDVRKEQAKKAKSDEYFARKRAEHIKRNYK